MAFTVEIDGLDEIDRDWAEARRALSDGLRKGVADGVKEGAAEARSVHRWKNQTGATEAGITGRVEVSTPGAATGIIESGAKHSTFLEEGTEPHEIRPKNAAALRWESGGEVHFAAVVHHPGTAPSPYMGPAAIKAEAVVLREVEVAEQKAAAIMAR